VDPTTDFGSYQIVEIHAYAEDEQIPPNILDGYYDFLTEDTEPPYLDNLNPAPDAVDVPLDSDVSLDILDNGIGVGRTTVRLWVDGILAYDGYNFLSPYDGPDAYQGTVVDGYRFVVDPTTDFDSYQTVEIHAEAEDWSSNLLDGYYTSPPLIPSRPICAIRIRLTEPPVFPLPIPFLLSG